MSIDNSAQVRNCCDMAEVTDSDRKRFFKKVKVSPSCWIWQGNTSWNGYGYFLFNKSRTRAHRFSYQLHNGEIPNELCVLHKCDVRKCVNPKHLFLGTRRDNCQDRTAKGRTAKGIKNGANTHPELNPIGERNGMSKLTLDEVERIKELAMSRAMSQREIGKMFGICQQNVSSILVGKNWNRALKQLSK